MRTGIQFGEWELRTYHLQNSVTFIQSKFGTGITVYLCSTGGSGLAKAQITEAIGYGVVTK